MAASAAGAVFRRAPAMISAVVRSCPGAPTHGVAGTSGDRAADGPIHAGDCRLRALVLFESGRPGEVSQEIAMSRGEGGDDDHGGGARRKCHLVETLSWGIESIGSCYRSPQGPWRTP